MNQNMNPEKTVPPTINYVEDNQTSFIESISYNDTNDYNENDSYDILQGIPDSLRQYDKFHYSIHGYLTLTIIIIGTIANIISMVVLTRKEMQSSINIILTALAFADMMLLITYLVKIKFHTDLEAMSYTEITYSLAVICMYVKHAFLIFHTASAWLTVVAAIWRVMSVCYPLSTTSFRNPSRAKISVICTYIASALVCIPEYLHYKIVTYADQNGDETYEIGETAMYLENKTVFHYFDTWGFNMILYIMPCIQLTGLTVTLIRNIYKGQNKRMKLSMGSATPDLDGQRLTVVLVVILLVFLVVKIPPGIMYVLDYGLDYKIVHQVHYVFSGTINALILFNSSINFFAYFCISSRFRAVAHSVFCKSMGEKVRRVTLRRMRKIEDETEMVDC